MVGEGGSQYCGHLSTQRDRSQAPTATGVQSPISSGTSTLQVCVARAKCVPFLLPDAIRFSEAVGSATKVREIGLQALSQLFPQFCLLCVPAHSPVDVQMCEILCVLFC